MSQRRRRLLESTGARFVALYLALTLLAALPIYFFIYQAADRLLLDQFRTHVADQLATLEAEHRAGGVDRLVSTIRSQAKGGASGDLAVLLVDSQGKPVVGNIRDWPPGLRHEAEWSELTLYRMGRSQPEKIGLTTGTLPNGYRILVGSVLTDRTHLREALSVALGGALLLGVPFGFLGSAILLRFMNSQVLAVSRVATRVASGDLTGRIPLRGTDDPFDQLASVLNAMLERIEGLLNELRIVTDSLAHDLRSPLTRMRAAIDRAQLAPPNDGMSEALTEVSAEIERMLKMLNATLEVSRAEAGIGRESFELFDVTELCRDLCEMYHPLAEEKSIQMRLEANGPLRFMGNRELLGQALANLIDNAIKYASGSSEVAIGVELNDELLRLFVADRGMGVPSADRATAIRKYRRLDSARSSDGAGLGLALVNAIAGLHGGRLVLEDNNPGLRAVIEMVYKSSSI